MRYLPADTTLDALRVQYKALRRIGIEGRSQMTADLCENVRRQVEAGVRWRHPEYNEEQVRMEKIRRILGPDLYKKVFLDREK